MNKQIIRHFSAVCAALITVMTIPGFASTAGLGINDIYTDVGILYNETDISSLNVSIPRLDYSFTGEEIKPVPTLKYNGVKLTEGMDYLVSYSDNVNIGNQSATIRIIGVGLYKGRITRSFNIIKRDLSECKADRLSEMHYTGRPLKPLPIIKYGSYIFKNGVDYTLSYSDNTKCGTGYVTVKGMNRLTGTLKIPFKIRNWDIVKDFGACPDDTKDDYAAFTKALTKAKTMPEGQKLVLEVPAGKYYVSKTLGIYSDTRLILDKKAEIINCTDNKTLLTVMGKNGRADGFKDYTEAHDITIEGGIWNGNGNNKTQARGIMVFRNSKNITIRNAVFTKVYGSHYLICDGINGLKVSGTAFKNYVPYTGSWKDYDFTKGTTDEKSRKSFIGAVEALHIDFAEDGTPCSNVEVWDCTFDGVPAGVGTHHINSKKGKNISVHDNTFKDIWFSCFHASSFTNVKMYNNKAVNSGLLFRCEDSVSEVYNNTFTGLKKMDPARYNADDVMYGVLSMKNSQLNLHDNTLRNIPGSGLLIMNNGNSVTKVRHNEITGCSLNGMYIDSAVVELRYNNIYNCKRNGISAKNATIDAQKNNILSCGASYAYLIGICANTIVGNNGITKGAAFGGALAGSVNADTNKPSISGYKVTIPFASYTYTGKEIKPKVTLKSGTRKLSDSVYKVTYQNNTKVGTATILVEGTGRYRGFIKRTFVIKPAPGSLKLTTANGAFKAFWPENKQASGYMFTYSKDKDFKKGVYTYTVNDSSKTSVLFSSRPKSGETWYIKYRAFVEADGVKYGNYSSVKSIKVK